jgi:hypothetical protein
MDALDYWRLCDELSVVQAALLIAGEDPSGTQDYIDQWRAENRPEGYTAAKAALANAIRGKGLRANIAEYEDFAEPNWHLTTISVEDLRVWLRSRGINTGFFSGAASRSRLPVPISRQLLPETGRRNRGLEGGFW